MTLTLTQQEFGPTIVRALDLCEGHYRGRLKAVFLAGSVAFGEAWPGASDVDLFVFVDPGPNEGDRAWAGDTSRALSGNLPAGSDFHLAVHPFQRLRTDETWRYLLRFFATQLHGGDSLADLERDGIHTPRPTKRMATIAVRTTRRVLDETMEDHFPERVFPLPSEPWKATRKLARWFMIHEGATLLIADDKFTSFRQTDVLRQLRTAFPQWADCFAVTERILTDPEGAGISPDEFMAVVAPFIRWATDRVGGVSSGISADTRCAERNPVAPAEGTANSECR